MRTPPFEAFRRQHPDTRLTTDLLVIHENHYVVRAQLFAEGRLLCTAMAADRVLEIAEDRACLRAMQNLGQVEPGLENGEPSEPQPPNWAEIMPSAQATTATPIKKPDKRVESQPDWVASAQLPPPGLEPAADVTRPVEPQASPPLLSQFEGEPDLAVLSDPSSPATPTDLTTGAAPDNAGPVDLSDIIAQTDVELRRLGWSVAQGREFLEKTYRKRSRHDLADQELLEFLLYLETQPTPVEP